MKTKQKKNNWLESYFHSSIEKWSIHMEWMMKRINKKPELCEHSVDTHTHYTHIMNEQRKKIWQCVNHN